MMHFSKVGAFLSASRITGPQHNILQLEISSGDRTLAVVETLGGTVATPLREESVVAAVMEGLAAANERFQRNWVVTRIRYSPADSGPEATYAHLAYSILANLEAGGYGEGMSAPSGHGRSPS